MLFLAPRLEEDHMDLRDRVSARLRAHRLDQALAAGAAPDSSAGMSLRARALVRVETRRELAGALRRLTRTGVSPGALGSRVTTSGPRVSAVRDDLERLAERLLEPGPVSARGVALTQELLTDGTGPLFWAESADDLEVRLHTVLEALEPRNSDPKPETEGSPR
jgi:hypothetical protein